MIMMYLLSVLIVTAASPGAEITGTLKFQHKSDTMDECVSLGTSMAGTIEPVPGLGVVWGCRPVLVNKEQK